MYDDFYNEPSESDVYIEQLKENLKKEIKEDILNEISRLRKENEELKEVKENISKLEFSYRQKEIELESQYKQKEDNLMKRPIRELLEIIKEKYYYVTRPYEYVKKCDKCDKDRKLELTDVYGRKHKVDCVCNRHEYGKFKVEEKYIGVITEINKRNGKFNMWVDFKYSNSAFYEDEYISGTFFDKSKVVYDYNEFMNIMQTKKRETIINKNLYWGYIFVNKKEAKLFAEWLNEGLVGENNVI